MCSLCIWLCLFLSPHPFSYCRRMIVQVVKSPGFCACDTNESQLGSNWGITSFRLICRRVCGAYSWSIIDVEDPAHCSVAIPGQVVLSGIRKLQKLWRKSGSSVLSRSLLHFLPSNFCWSSSLNFPHWWTVKGNKLFPAQVGFSQCVTTVTEHKLGPKVTVSDVCQDSRVRSHC